MTHQGISAELIARKWDIPREELDEFSLHSHQRAARRRRRATSTARSCRSRCPTAPSFTRDEGIRRDTTLEKLAALQPAFKPDGVITAGGSSQISDGAAAVLLMTPEKAAAAGPAPRARIVAQRVVGVDPVMMLDRANSRDARQVLKRAGLTWTRSTCSRSTRHSRPWCWPGSASCGPTWTRQRQRRRDRAGPSARRVRRAPDDDAAPRAGAPRRSLWPADDVLRRRHRHRDDHRAGVGLRNRP